MFQAAGIASAKALKDLTYSVVDMVPNCIFIVLFC